MGVVLNPESELAKELAKWEQGPDHPVRRRPQPFPKMLYRAEERSDGRLACLVGEPSPLGWGNDMGAYQQAILEAESFNRRCQMTVQNEAELLMAKGQGWAEHPHDAIELAKARQKEFSDQAANAAWHASRMSELAQREFQAAQDETADHVADIPAPKKRPGRPKKTEVITE